MTMRKRVTDARLAGNIGEYCTESIARMGQNKKKIKKNIKKLLRNLVEQQKSHTFATAYEKQGRLAQLV